jgi:hypothetical protein
MECEDEDPGFWFGSRHNVWGFGKVMYDLLTLSEFEELYEVLRMEPVRHLKYWYNFRLTEQEYHSSGQHFMPEIRTIRQPEYSLRLRELIRECLRLNINHRPSPEVLLEMTSCGLNIAIAKARTASGQQVDLEDRLYFKGNEINRMTPGTTNFRMSDRMWRELQNNLFPDETPLNLPRAWNGYRLRDQQRQEDDRRRAIEQARRDAKTTADGEVYDLLNRNREFEAQLAGLKGKRKVDALDTNGGDQGRLGGNVSKKWQFPGLGRGSGAGVFGRGSGRPLRGSTASGEGFPGRLSNRGNGNETQPQVPDSSGSTKDKAKEGTGSSQNDDGNGQVDTRAFGLHDIDDPLRQLQIERFMKEDSNLKFADVFEALSSTNWDNWSARMRLNELTFGKGRDGGDSEGEGEADEYAEDVDEKNMQDYVEESMQDDDDDDL